VRALPCSNGLVLAIWFSFSRVCAGHFCNLKIDFSKRDEVFVHKKGIAIGKGMVVKHQPTKILQGTTLGISCSRVCVTEVINKTTLLPYPMNGLTTLLETCDERLY
jgi:hypothetical protein